MRNITFLLFSLISAVSFAQTGPGGVGSAASTPFWLDANRLTLNNNDPVATWTDLSGNGNNASQAFASRRPLFITNTLNSKPVVRFDGINDYVETGAIAALNTNTLTWYFVGTTNNNTINQDFISSNYTSGTTSAPNRLWGTQISSSTSTYRSFTRSSSGAKINNLGYNGGFQLISNIWNGNTAFSSYRNGTLMANSTGANATPTDHVRTRFGASPAATEFFLNGSMAEVFTFSFVLNSAQRVIVDNYLAAKYNLAVPNDQYAFEAAHGNDVAGIGQEADGGNTDAKGSGIVRMNTASDFQNSEYLLWGHNNVLLATMNSTDVIPGSDERFDRTWRVSETGDVGTTTISFDLTGLTIGNPSGLELWIDADGTFSDGNATIYTTGRSFDSGTNILTFTGLNLNHGDYFTLGSSAIISVASGNWNTASTWNCNCIPNNTNAVIINTGHTVSIDAAASVRNLTINATSALNITNASTLTVNGNVTNSGTLSGGTAGTVLLSGTTVQNLSGAGVYSFFNLTLNNAAGANLTGSATLLGSLTLTSGTFNTGNALTLLSNATGTGRIATIPGGADITGNITMQRLVPAGRTGWRMISSPVSGQTIANWQDDFATSGFTGATGSAGGSFVSVYTYNEAVAGPINNGYVAATNVTNPIDAPTGFYVYMGTGSSTTAAINIDVTGAPMKGAFNPSISYTPSGSPADDGWNLIGNPLPSQVDFNAMTKVGLDNKLQIWNASCNCYGVWDGDAMTSTNGATNIIASSQSFFIHATSSPSIAIDENSKSAAAHTFVRREQQEANTLRLLLETPNAEYSDESVIRFDNNSSSEYDNYDTYKLTSPDEKACYVSSYSSDNTNLIINSLPEVSGSTTIPVKVKAGFEGDFKLKIKGLETLSSQNCVTLKDNKTNETIDLNATNEYSFTVSNSSNDRFFDLIISSTDSDCNRMVASSEINSSVQDIRIIRTSDGVFAEFSSNEIMQSTISVTNILGQNIVPDERVNIQSGRVKVNIPENKGIYLIQIRTPQKTITKKLSF